MRVFRADCYKKMPWKNGLGVSTELFIYPKNSTITDLNFVWRLSSADLPPSSRFSFFAGYKRYLSLIRGDSMSLNSANISKYLVNCFSGDEEIECKVTGDKCQDIGLIYNPQKVTPDFKIVSTQTVLENSAIVVCLNESIGVNDSTLVFLDSAIADKSTAVKASIKNPALIIYGLAIDF